jgi:hypothetical protein
MLLVKITIAYILLRLAVLQLFKVKWPHSDYSIRGRRRTCCCRGNLLWELYCGV